MLYVSTGTVAIGRKLAIRGFIRGAGEKKNPIPVAEPEKKGREEKKNNNNDNSSPSALMTRRGDERVKSTRVLSGE